MSFYAMRVRFAGQERPWPEALSGARLTGSEEAR